MESAQNKLRMATEDLGGDYAAMDVVATDLRGITISGRAFDCRAAPAPLPVTVVHTSGSSAPDAPSDTRPPTADERLQRLQKLRDDGLITEEEYVTKRQAIIGEL